MDTSLLSGMKREKINWSLAENKARLELAVEEWLSKSGKYLDCNGKILAFSTYENRIGISRHLPQNYCHRDPSKRRK